ncbi:MAG TPA: DNA-3-methyladenine glycosylase [Chitinophagaceae bacterium]|nr:DNA-3-methyladenine glycosylase [Chitinophagaceae bacterium]
MTKGNIKPQNSLKKLPAAFYRGSDVVQIAKDLLGKIIVTNFNNEITTARIVETEAYNGIIDRASHAYNNRRTARTEIMYSAGGFAYVYLCYGIHHLFNVVTNEKNIPHAVLVRAAEPLTGIEIMMRRTGKKILDNTLTRGPGNFSKALGISTAHTGTSLLGNEIYIAENFDAYPFTIASSPRIGVAYAKEDALLAYRFYIRGNQYVSGVKTLLSKK